MVPLTVALPAPAPPPDEVRRIVAEVLSRPEYTEAAPSLVARVRGWLAEQLGRLLEAVVGTGQASLIGSLLLVVAVAVAVVLAVRFARALRRDPDAVAVTADGVGRHPADWAAEADAHEAAGRYREAVRCRYRHVIAVLAAAGVVDEAPGRTTGEYLAQALDRRPDAGDDLTAVTRAFEAAWYGHAPVDAAALEAVRAHGDAVRAVVSARAAPPVVAGRA